MNTIEFIRFKGIRQDNGKDWAYGNLIPVLKRKVIDHYVIGQGYGGGSIYGNPVITKTIGQYTGIKDINGKPIYEGDIVRYRWTDERFKKNPQYSIATVIWDGFSSRWGLQGEKYIYINPDFYSKKMEVIGNIHEKPEEKIS